MTSDLIWVSCGGLGLVFVLYRAARHLWRTSHRSGQFVDSDGTVLWAATHDSSGDGHGGDAGHD